MFSSTSKIRIDKGLYERLASMARRSGYSTTEEFITHVLEREVSSLEEAASDEDVDKRLRGLGYIE